MDPGRLRGREARPANPMNPYFLALVFGGVAAAILADDDEPKSRQAAAPSPPRPEPEPLPASPPPRPSPWTFFEDDPESVTAAAAPQAEADAPAGPDLPAYRDAVPSARSGPDLAPAPSRRRFTPTRPICLEDVASVFAEAGGELTRKQAVDALKALGFGKTAAYDALKRGGRFSANMVDVGAGLLCWTD